MHYNVGVLPASVDHYFLIGYTYTSHSSVLPILAVPISTTTT